MSLAAFPLIAVVSVPFTAFFAFVFRAQAKAREFAKERVAHEASTRELRARVETMHVTIKFYEDMLEGERAKVRSSRALPAIVPPPPPPPPPPWVA